MNSDFWHQIFGFDNYGELLALVKNSIIAGALLGVVGGLIGPFVMTRDLAFAVHGISELSFAGASAALLFGVNVVAGSIGGSLLAALLIGVLGTKARERNSIIAVLMPFGLGLGILFLALYKGRSANKFGLLTGQIVSVDNPQLLMLVIISAVVIAALFVIWRPLSFASVDADVARAKGLPVTGISIAFMILLGLATAVSIQIVGALLVLSLLVTPAAAAMRVTASPLLTPLLSVAFAVTSVVATISFLIYIVCRVIGARRSSRGATGRLVTAMPGGAAR
jgi:zinc/manganese transport system permease protein